MEDSNYNKMISDDMDDLQVHQQQVLDPFDTFLASLGSSLDLPFPWKMLHKAITVVDKRFPTARCLIRNYKTDFQKNIKDRQKIRWSPMDKKFLVWLVYKYVERQHVFGKVIAQQILNLDLNVWNYISNLLQLQPECLMRQWQILRPESVKDQEWLPEEDSLIMQLASSHKPRNNWKMLSERLFERTGRYRFPKQIRGRWHNYLNPEITKETWRRDEDISLLQHVQKLGKRWSQISRIMRGRNENMVKNRYNSLLRRIKNVRMVESCDTIKHTELLEQQKLKLVFAQLLKNEEENEQSSDSVHEDNVYEEDDNSEVSQQQKAHDDARWSCQKPANSVACTCKHKVSPPQLANSSSKCPKNQYASANEEQLFVNLKVKQEATGTITELHNTSTCSFLSADASAPGTAQWRQQPRALTIFQQQQQQSEYAAGYLLDKKPGQFQASNNNYLGVPQINAGKNSSMSAQKVANLTIDQKPKYEDVFLESATANYCTDMFL